MSTSRKGQGVIPMIGRRFGRLTVTGQDTVTPNQHHARWLCLCDCGKAHSASGVVLRNGGVRSCGCYRADVSRARNTTHGHAGKKSTTKIYMVWRAMLGRCHDSKNRNFPEYGGRGIYVCDSWRVAFQNFLDDMGEAPKGMTLERGDVNGGYSKANCFWASRRDQSRNTRRTKRIGGKAIITICEEIGILPKTVFARIKAGVPPEIALHMNLRQYKAQNKPHSQGDNHDHS